MPLYHWRSKAMKQYGHGHVIVEAPDPETARSRVMSAARMQYAHDHGAIDDDDKRLLQTFKQELARDLSEKPDVTFVVFIPGSE